jgi:hypothetical protein
MHDDLARVFGDRLISLLAYGSGGHRMAIVRTLTHDDLAALLPLVRRWRAAGLETPLLLTHAELTRTLDIFPIEYGEILARHERLAGIDPFAGLAIAPEHLRQACERQVKSHLIHLREGLLETEGRPSALADLVTASAGPFRALLRAVVRLTADRSASPSPDVMDDAGLARFCEDRLGLPSAVVRDVIGSSGGRPVDAASLMPAYLDLTERLWAIVDTWRA